MKMENVLSKLVLLLVCMISGGCEKNKLYQEQIFLDALVSKPNDPPKVKSIKIFITSEKAFLNEKVLIDKGNKNWELIGNDVTLFLEQFHYQKRINTSDMTLKGSMYQGFIYDISGGISTFRMVADTQGSISIKGSFGTIWVVKGSLVDFLE
jgi:hypothetical protein